MNSFSRQIRPVAQSAAVQREPRKGGRNSNWARTTEKSLFPYSAGASNQIPNHIKLEVDQDTLIASYEIHLINI